MGSRWEEASVQGPSQWAFKLGRDKRSLPASYLCADNTHLSCSCPVRPQGLGFPRQACLQALRATNGNEEMAGSLLFGG